MKYSRNDSFRLTAPVAYLDGYLCLTPGERHTERLPDIANPGDWVGEFRIAALGNRPSDAQQFLLAFVRTSIHLVRKTRY